MLFFPPSLVPPEKVIRHMTSDYDVCEIDLDMQMSFLNAAPFDSMWRGAPKEWRRLEQKLCMGDVGREIK